MLTAGRALSIVNYLLCPGPHRSRDSLLRSPSQTSGRVIFRAISKSDCLPGCLVCLPGCLHGEQPRGRPSYPAVPIRKAPTRLSPNSIPSPCFPIKSSCLPGCLQSSEFHQVVCLPGCPNSDRFRIRSEVPFRIQVRLPTRLSEFWPPFATKSSLSDGIHFRIPSPPSAYPAV
jgi:hypothetical protein